MRNKLLFLKYFILSLRLAQISGRGFDECFEDVVEEYKEKAKEAKHQLAKIKERGFTTEDDRRRIKKLERAIASEPLLNSF